jgi:hypothetical protein
MAFENFPTAESNPPVAPQPNRTDWRTFLSIGLVIALLGTWGYIIWDKSKTKEVLQQKESQLFSVRTEKDTLQSLLDEATNRYDQLKTNNAKKDSTITARDREISEKKGKDTGPSFQGQCDPGRVGTSKKADRLPECGYRRIQATNRIAEDSKCTTCAREGGRNAGENKS